jgi:hypothetical protein
MIKSVDFISYIRVKLQYIRCIQYILGHLCCFIQQIDLGFGHPTQSLYDPTTGRTLGYCWILVLKLELRQNSAMPLIVKFA